MDLNVASTVAEAPIGLLVKINGCVQKEDTLGNHILMLNSKLMSIF